MAWEKNSSLTLHFEKRKVKRLSLQWSIVIGLWSQKKTPAVCTTGVGYDFEISLHYSALPSSLSSLDLRALNALRSPRVVF